MSGRLSIYYKVLSNIRNNPNMSISVSNLWKLCKAAKLDLKIVEKSVQTIRFSSHGKKENLSFPFTMNIYAWRALCHIIGDGTIDKRNSSPTLTWTQQPKNQGFMRDLLERLSRRPGGKSERVNFPKGLTYLIISTMPSFTLNDLKTPKFIQFIIDLPPIYHAWKVQFLAAFLLDDGCVSKNLYFGQKNKVLLENVMRLCDQLGYEHTPYPPKLRGRGYTFGLYQRGVIQFYNDLCMSVSKDPLLGLWHKHDELKTLVASYDLKTVYAREFAKKVCLTIIKILGDHKIRNTNELRFHSKLKTLLKGRHPDFLIQRLKYLHERGFIHQIKKGQRVTKPYVWVIPAFNDPKMLIKEYQNSYGTSHIISKKYVQESHN
ncbi:MAG: hypothetical protein ACFFB5_00945 [Promethearchaeota archaeon]